jgi:AGCS family alanine or glycine:cation symporter
MIFFNNIFDFLLTGPFILIFVVSGILTILSRGIQFRCLSIIKKIFNNNLNSHNTKSSQELPPLSALAINISTTIGIGNIMGPIVALGYGGPGTLIGFLLGTFLGGATTFTEVFLSVFYKKQSNSKTSGPMTYLEVELGKPWAYMYAFFGSLLLVAWSMSQSNTLATLLSEKGISPFISGLIIISSSIFILTKGLDIISKISNIMVPVMFILYSVATLWIIICNAYKLPEIAILVFKNFLSPQTGAGALAGFGYATMIRWGFARAVQANEIGTGTSTFPHSITSSTPSHQASLATIADYMNGFLCTLSSLTLLVCDVWKDSATIYDITVFNKILVTYYGTAGTILLFICAFLFAFGTILGNCYNGSQCFLYITKNKWLYGYYIFTALFVFWGTISKVSFVWNIADYFVIPVAVPHIIGLLIIAWKKPSIFEL